MLRFSRSATWTAPAACLLWAACFVQAQTGAKNGEWSTYGGDLGSTRYSPLDQINASNFNHLDVAWRFQNRIARPPPGLSNMKGPRCSFMAGFMSPPDRAAT